MKWVENDLCIYHILFHSGVRPAGKVIDRHGRARSNQGLLYIVDGSVRFMQEGKEDKFALTNDIVIIPKGQKYTMEYIGEQTRFYLVNFKMMTPDGEDYNLTEDIEIVLHGLSSIYLEELFRKIEASCEDEKSISFFKRKEYVYRLLAELFQDEKLAFLPKLPKYAVISKGVQMLQELYLENISTAEFAAACNISVSSFRQLFTEYYGVSPIQYRNSLRMKRAISLLHDGELNIAEVAAACGFVNESYFCRYYKKMTGETPSETRQG